MSPTHQIKVHCLSHVFQVTKSSFQHFPTLYMAFTSPRAGQGSSIFSILKRNFQLITLSRQQSGASQRRSFSSQQLEDIQNKQVQIYKSTSSNPYINLSIEHHLLQHSHPDSTVLFLYTNRPCVVIGRNQNPWLEVNLNLLRQGIKPPGKNNHGSIQQKVDLVRRRSGGGTVFHDEGNVNWSVICPPPNFDRDKHAEMVVRALHGLNIRGTPRVNERHDIVLDVDNTTYKISGSAYKLTRQRSLHHGTCLLSSPNLKNISDILKSPAEPYIKARGVDSVRSKVCNVEISNDEFIGAVVDEFQNMYGDVSDGDMLVHEASSCQVPKIEKGIAELMSPEWIYGQTPLFTFSTHPTEDDTRTRPPLPESIPENLQITLTARHGEIQEATVSGLYSYPEDSLITNEDGQRLLAESLLKRKLHDIKNWNALFHQLSEESKNPADAQNVGKWLNAMFCPLD